MVSPRTDSPKRDFAAYKEFTQELRELANARIVDKKWIKNVEACLNGAAIAAARRLVELDVRRESGVFFTGHQLAKRLLGNPNFNPKSDFIYDPTVGAGDLLLAAARHLPLGRTIVATLTTWGQCLAGTDLQSEFIEAAKLRVALLARLRHGNPAELPNRFEKLFPFIRVGDGLTQRDLYSRATHLIMNPPFTILGPILDCGWAGGRVSVAALFIIRALEQANPGTRLLAVLPDVLRSGSFQNRWREHVSALADVGSVKAFGLFDDSANVDVFLLDARRREDDQTTGRCWPKPATLSIRTTGTYFSVSVGSVVPHRDPKRGPYHIFIHPRCVPSWTLMRTFAERRRHNGRVHEPPFVVIRRTSRPDQRHRATATVISGKMPVAVENHLIVCKPRNGTLKACKELMRQLKTDEANTFLNRRIRCRHLTVDAVESIPFDPS